MPRRRIRDQLTGQHGLADWVIARHLLARRVLGGPLLAQLVAPAPARRGMRPRPAFRPRLIASLTPAQTGIAPWINAIDRAPDDEGSWAVASPFVGDDQPESAARDDAQGEPTESVQHMDASPAEPDDVVQPREPGQPHEPPRPASRVDTIVPPLSQSTLPPQRVSPPRRERLGRRVEERVQAAPSETAMAPAPAAPMPESAGAAVSPRVEQPSANLPAPSRAETPGASGEAGVALPTLPETPSVHSIDAIAPAQRQTEVPGASMHAEAMAPPVAETQATDLLEEVKAIEAVVAVVADAANPPDLVVTPRDEAMQPFETHPPAVSPDWQGQSVPPEMETHRAERLANEEILATPSREVASAESANAESGAVAEHPQSDVSPDVPIATPAAALPPAPLPVVPEEASVADLFASRGTDRSPAAWLARLTGAAPPQPEQPDAPASAALPAPAPPAPHAVSPPFLAPTPRFVAPMQARTPVVEPVGAEETRADAVGPAPEIAATTGLDASVVRESGREIEQPSTIDNAPLLPGPERGVIEQGAEPAMTAASEDDGARAPMRPMPDAVPVAPHQGGRDAELFRPSGADRSPAAWVERLMRAEDAPVKREPAAPMTRDQPTRGEADGGPRPVMPPDVADEENAPAPLPEATRRFLQPLVGVDPVSVPVYEGSRAEAVTAAYRADALTDGNVVLLGAGHAAGSPETLGLIAHELTHVARRRDPRFIPPIARAGDRAGRSDPAAGAEPEPDATALITDDETLAQRVETRVAQAVQASGSTPSVQPSALVAGENRLARTDALVERPSGETARREPADDRWGGLPAPWEPLPDWLLSPAPDAPAPTNALPLPPAAPAFAPMAAPALAPVAPAPQLAEQGRESDGNSAVAAPASAPASSHDAHEPAEPDLDALAQQVYALLKRRLALERRSFG